MRYLRFRDMKALKNAIGKWSRIRDTFQKPHDSTATKHGRVPRRRKPGPTPHEILWDAVSRSISGAEREYRGAVPGRRFRIDIALPAVSLAIEIDGWQWHGKHKGDFARDRERQNLLTIHGWRILRFTAGQIRKDVNGCIEIIKKASMREHG